MNILADLRCLHRFTFLGLEAKTHELSARLGFFDPGSNPVINAVDQNASVVIWMAVLLLLGVLKKSTAVISLFHISCSLVWVFFLLSRPSPRQLA